MVGNMFSVNRTIASRDARATALGKGRLGVTRVGSDGERGSSIVELALVMPIFLIMVMGLYSFGLLFTEYISLTEAVNVGGQQLSLQRFQQGDPCAKIAANVVAASPFLKASKMAYTFSVNGVSTGTTFGENVTPTCPSLATTLAAEPNPGTSQTSVTLKATYYCTGVTAIKFGNLANFNPLPTASCTLTSQITEVLQ
ncbi:TadE/TadG family type IV pilus assembly protein [Acidicapsa acidisoli]|uniref:TadE/TadG family type IV pilus assembly protein n=1 Tax=Acidicapsa acidisoli TaxID=1615681 RepID=UPI0021DF675E|nr:TadE/TadG family type IV pilus assembly protein [Acidicapsa acidisoli]